MSTKIQAPNKRIPQAGIGNPLFVTDIQNVNEDLLFYVNMLLGLPNPGFAILQGLTYTSGGAGSYSSGYVYLNGQIYYFAGTLTGGNYLNPSNQLVDSKLFGDGNSYTTYQVFYVVSSSTPVSGCPVFSGDMNAYRFNMTAMQGTIPGKVPVIGSNWTFTTGGDIRLVMIDTDGTIKSFETMGGALPVTTSSFDNSPKYLRTKSDFTVEQRTNAQVLSDLSLYSQSQTFSQTQLGNFMRSQINNSYDGSIATGAQSYFAHGLPNIGKVFGLSIMCFQGEATIYAAPAQCHMDATNIYFTWPGVSGSSWNTPTIQGIIDYTA